jgi:hypothetical protein
MQNPFGSSSADVTHPHQPDADEQTIYIGGIIVVLHCGPLVRILSDF